MGWCCVFLRDDYRRRPGSHVIVFLHLYQCMWYWIPGEKCNVIFASSKSRYLITLSRYEWRERQECYPGISCARWMLDPKNMKETKSDREFQHYLSLGSVTNCPPIDGPTYLPWKGPITFSTRFCFERGAEARGVFFVVRREILSPIRSRGPERWHPTIR